MKRHVEARASRKNKLVKKKEREIIGMTCQPDVFARDLVSSGGLARRPASDGRLERKGHLPDNQMARRFL